jgi:hypothetical protein
MLLYPFMAEALSFLVAAERSEAALGSFVAMICVPLVLPVL